ncbi:MAG: hypothetical protein QM500_20610 [Methylococcales bacterium]
MCPFKLQVSKALCLKIKMFNDSIIKKTNQWCKASLSFLGLISGSAFMLAGFIRIEKERIFITLIFIDMLIGITALLFGCMSIRCPECNNAKKT